MSALSALIPVFLLLVIGAGSRRSGLLDGAAAAGLNRLVANVALPALLLLTVGTTPLQVSFVPGVALVATGVTVVAAVLGLLGARLVRLPAPQQGVVAQAAMRSNIAYVAFPVVLATLGQEGLRVAAVTAAVLIPVMNFVAVVVLELPRPSTRGTWGMALRVGLNPLVASAFAGLALAAAGWQPWPWLASLLGILADFALPGALLALGAELTAGRWAPVWRPVVAVTVGKMVAVPALGWWLMALLGVSGPDLAVGVLLLAAPTAVASYSVAAELGGDTILAGACVVATTLVTPFAYFLLLMLLA